MLSSSSSHALRAMSLDAIRGFESAARHPSFTIAAEELCITQSAMSKQVKGLRDSLGAALFLRAGKGLSLTPQGRELCEAARKSLAQLASAVDCLLAADRVSVAGQGYRIVTSDQRATQPAVQKFCAWLEQVPARDAMG